MPVGYAEANVQCDVIDSREVAHGDILEAVRKTIADSLSMRYYVLADHLRSTLAIYRSAQDLTTLYEKVGLHFAGTPARVAAKRKEAIGVLPANIRADQRESVDAFVAEHKLLSAVMAISEGTTRFFPGAVLACSIESLDSGDDESPEPFLYLKIILRDQEPGIFERFTKFNADCAFGITASVGGKIYVDISMPSSE